MRLISFYINYLKVYFKSGKLNHWMENEARVPFITEKWAMYKLIQSSMKKTNKYEKVYYYYI